MLDILKIKFKGLNLLLKLLALFYILEFSFIVLKVFDNANTIFLFTQLIFVPLFGILVLCLFYDLFATKSSTFLYTFYRGKAYKVYLLCLGLYMMPLLMLCVLISICYEPFNSLAAFFLLSSQVLLFSTLSLIIFILLSDMSITISLFILYISAEVATFGENNYLYHMFYMDLHQMVSFSNVSSTLVLNLIIGLLGYKVFKSIVA
ncbi:hypothetical protein [Priestia megaterium]|jgi:hypothetical protein|uniref:hypothetical protein n=1 Tax=Priestia megaterium TaxID=1404 RepID=UPI0023DC052A|nr:hypothetical protein [Priestia megaterium]MDF2052728.1 hypothetical protein [Priestia megaterium]MDF2058850.1 hypothetical protein [Priestia megaterium]